jgi:hypothetical protein
VSEESVEITAEWALWGKESRDAGYRLLECSAGPADADLFTTVITRYSPGTLETLPQVTVSWLRHDGMGRCVGLAIHDTEAGRYDVAGRTIMFTRYFCVPYEEMARSAVSYEELYAAVQRFRLEPGDRAPVRVELHRPGVRGVARDPLTMRVAALLMTSKPVCVLGAEGSGFTDRLRFVDRVAALLPYGMRSELSAATWASSTFEEHKFRLFFASTARRGDDHVVRWRQPEDRAIGHRYADDYLSWLVHGGDDPEDALAGKTELYGSEFEQPKILMRLEQLGVSYRERAQSAPGHALVPASSHRSPALRPDAGDVFRSCGQRLRGGSPNFLDSELERLRACLADPVTEADRNRFQQIVAEQGLLRADTPVKKAHQQPFYRMVLQLAFGISLDYQAYCAVEECAGGVLRESLLLAMAPGRLTDPRARLLVLHAMGGKELRKALRTWPLPVAALVAAAADSELRPAHAKILCEIVIDELEDCAESMDRRALREALVRHGHLAQVIARLYSGQHQYQMEQLGRLLRAAYGAKLNDPAILEVLASRTEPPTHALFAAVGAMVAPAQAPLWQYAFCHGVLSTLRVDSRKRGQLLASLPPGDTWEEPWQEQGSPVGAGPDAGKRGRRWDFGLLPHWRSR